MRRALARIEQGIMHFRGHSILDPYHTPFAPPWVHVHSRAGTAALLLQFFVNTSLVPLYNNFICRHHLQKHSVGRLGFLTEQISMTTVKNLEEPATISELEDGTLCELQIHFPSHNWRLKAIPVVIVEAFFFCYYKSTEDSALGTWFWFPL
jgi:hypothetical protein